MRDARQRGNLRLRSQVVQRYKGMATVLGNVRAGGVFGGWCPVTLAPKKRENSRVQRALADLSRLQGQTLRFPGQTRARLNLELLFFYWKTTRFGVHFDF